MDRGKLYVSVLATTGWAIATLVISGVLEAGAFAGIPAEIMNPWLSWSVVGVALLAAVPMGGRIRPSQFEDWELVILILSLVVLAAKYPLTMEGYITGDLEMAYAWFTFVALSSAFGLINFR